MNIVIQAHFDGVHLVPDEPVDLPVGAQLRIRVETTPDASTPASQELLSPVIVGLDRDLALAIGGEPELEAENL
ncbi:hypothetical protein Pla175_03380 [Pirellulimonas nuda]|uniref:DUF104 domain-containing protein n=1 Tax=Pirellulimonas nuda TaxID=2528009 RepID=A0A518D687_9BACT|nr:hypothetical protein [Pirellulimonas nuda]QDU86984.1 hypothetical protein Pla175_03380 [Pirellulimonas nuda]